jgi:hypothetical protein
MYFKITGTHWVTFIDDFLACVQNALHLTCISSLALRRRHLTLVSKSFSWSFLTGAQYFVLYS